ncbi:hypothetical protein CEG15_09520 [Vibrio anguillarum]|nr:hypothetical protein CEG15_09520 [Vibrio anguillarum]
MQKIFRKLRIKYLVLIYIPVIIEFTTAINEFFNVTLPNVAGSLVSRITDNFQIMKPASSS